MEKLEMKFEPEGIQALQIMEKTNKCMYLTGKAGAGKSTLINYFISKTKKKFILLGTTGISAINISGQTIHSFFGIVPNGRTRIKAEAKQAIKETDIFIIDEVSMMRADLFDKLDLILRWVMDNENFMGGKQIVFVGDLFQIPPVPERDGDIKEAYDEKYKGLFFFHGISFLREYFEIVELQKVYRQDDPVFINMLNRMRVGDNTSELIKYFNKKVIDSPDDINPKAILIATTNKIVNEKNELELRKLPGDADISTAIVKGDYPEDSYPTERVLRMKKGARIMFTVNDNKNFDYVNGTLGTIIAIQYNPNGFIDLVRIETDDGNTLSVVKNVWNETNGEDEFGEPIIVGNFIQFPFKLAFAITIHKVQGKSFDNVVIDLGRGAFTEGQTYVAISRCRNYEGLQFMKPLKPKDIKVSFDVIKFLK